MAINNNISRLATEDELTGALSIFDPNFMSLSPEQKQQNAMSALEAYGGDRNQLLANFNRQFGQSAGMADLDYLLNYRPADQRQVVSGPSQAEADLRALYKDVLGRDPDQEGLQYWLGQVGPTLEANEREWWMGGARDELSKRVVDNKSIDTGPGRLIEEDAVKPNTSEVDYGSIIRQAYQTALGRDPSDQNFNYILGQLKDGSILPENLPRVLAFGASTDADKRAANKYLGEDFFKFEEAKPLSGLDYATKPGGIGQEQYYTNIRNRVTDVANSGLSTFDQAAKLREEAGQYNISNQDIATALGISLADVNALLNPTADQDLSVIKDTEKDVSSGETKDSANFVSDFQGNKFDKSEILNLASQIGANLDVSKIGGAVYGTTGKSVGFDFDQAKKILGRDPKAGDQVLLDMARFLRQKGVTDLSQIKTEDKIEAMPVYTIEGKKMVVGPDGQLRELTADELKTLSSSTSTDPEGAEVVNETANVVTGKQTVGPDGKPIYLYGEDGGNVFGETYTGEGATDYVMVFDEKTGKPKFYTTGRSTSDMEKISMAMTFLSFIPGVAPFIQAVQGAYALKQGDPLAAIANLAGAAGYGDVARIAGAANAASKGDILAAAFSLAGTSFGADFLKTDLGGGFTMNDVVTAGKIVSGIDKGYDGLALSAAGDLMKSSDLKVASAGINVYSAIKSGDPLAMIRAVDDANKIIQYIGGNTTAKDTIATAAPAGSGLTVPGSTPKVSLTETGKASLTGTGSLSDQAWEAGLTSFMNASKSGLSFDDALARSNREIGNLLSSESRGALATPFTGIADLKSKEDWDKAVNAYTYAINKGADPKDAFSFSKLVASGQQVIPTETKLDSNNVTLTDVEDKSTGGGTKVTSIKINTASGDKDVGTIYVFGPKAQKSYSEVMNLPGARPLDLVSRKDGEMWEVDDQTFYKSGDKIYSMPTVAAQVIGVPMAAMGEMMSAAGGVSAALGADQNNWLTKVGNELNSKGIQALGSEVNNQRKNIVAGVQGADGLIEKLKSIVPLAFDNPLGAASYVAVELPQEFAVIGAAAKIAKLFGFAVGAGADMGMNALEAAGAGYNEAYNQAIRAGKSPAEARSIALDRALVDAGTAATIGSVVDLATIKTLTKGTGDVVTGGAKTLTGTAADVGKGAGQSLSTTIKEFVSEGSEGAIGAVVTDLGVNGKIDWNNVWNAFTIEGAIGGKTGGTIQSTVSAIGPDSSTADVVFSSVSNNPDAVISTISSITSQGGTPADVAASLQSSLADLGLSQDQISNITNTTIAESAVNQMNAGGSFSIGDVGTIVGTDSSGANVTLGDVIANASLNQGATFTLDSNAVIGTSADGSSMTLGDLAKVSSGGTVVDTTSDGNVTTQKSVDNVTGSETVATADGNNNTASTVTTNSNNGTTVTTVVDGNAGTKSDTKVDSLNNTETVTTTDLSTGSTSTVSTDNNAGVTSTSTVDGNVKTDTLVDAKNGTDTTTTVDGNNNTSTVIQSTNDTNSNATVDGNNNTANSVDVDLNTGVTTTTDLDAKNGTVSTVTGDLNSEVKVTVDANNNTQNTVTTDGNVTTNVTIDSNNNVATNVTTDLNTNTQITTTVDTTNNVVITVTTDLETGEKKTVEKPIDEVPIAELLKIVDPTKTTSTTTKASTVNPPAQLPLALGAALAANPSLAAEFENLFSGPSKKFKSPLDDFMQQVDENYAQQVAEQEAAEAAQRAQEEQMRKYYSYGREREIDDILGEDLLGESPLSESFEGLGMSDMYPKAAKAGGLMTPLMAKGGNPPAVHYAGKPRIDFRRGAHVAGPGDGQSDDIPAMLADGEFVFPADVVAALGNGSTKAGSDKLYEMMHEIRRSYRSAKPKDLPPPAKKSPLEYLSKKGRR